MLGLSLARTREKVTMKGRTKLKWDVGEIWDLAGLWKGAKGRGVIVDVAEEGGRGCDGCVLRWKKKCGKWDCESGWWILRRVE